MRILQVHNLYALPGGEDTIADTEADVLEAAGHEVDRFRVRNAEGGAAAARALLEAPWNMRQQRAMAARVRDWRPDLAHVHNTWFTLSPAIFHALRAEGVPTVMTLQNYRLICAKAQLFRDGRPCTDCVGTHPWRGVQHACYRDSVGASAIAASTIAVARARRTWDGIDRFIAPSEFVKRVFVGAGMAAERIFVKPNMVPDPGPRAQPPSASCILLCAGRLSPEKGVSMLLEAWCATAAEVPELELHVVGDGPLRGALERLGAPRVRFIDWVAPAQLTQMMLEARALLFPSIWYENFGRVIVEALAAGLPVLASDIATPAEVVGELGARWLVKPDDRAAWTGALCSLADSAAVDDAGLRARELFEAKYGFATGLERLLEAYAGVLPSAGEPERATSRQSSA